MKTFSILLIFATLSACTNTVSLLPKKEPVPVMQIQKYDPTWTGKDCYKLYRLIDRIRCKFYFKAEGKGK